MEKAEWWKPTHILMVDDYYLGQYQAINDLVRHFREIDLLAGDVIRGASTWVKSRSDTIRPKKRFYDTGTTPEAANLKFETTDPRAWAGGPVSALRTEMFVAAVGACYIFPIEAWRKNGYQCNPDKFVPEHVSLCKGYTCILDLNVKLWRNDRTDAIYPLTKALRVKAGKWRRKVVHF